MGEVLAILAPLGSVFVEDVLDDLLARLVGRSEEQVIDRFAQAIDECQRARRVRESGNVEEALTVRICDLLVCVRYL